MVVEIDQVLIPDVLLLLLVLTTINTFVTLSSGQEEKKVVDKLSL